MTRTIDIPETALNWHRHQGGAVLVTVMETWGSAPRPVGSQMAISATGEIAGSVSGGCVEGAVIVEAQEALAAGEHRVLEFGVSDDNAFAVGLACGGTIRVLLEPVGTVLPVDTLDQIIAARAARRIVAYLVDVTHGTRQVLGTDDPDFGAMVAERSARDQSGHEGETLVVIYNPPLTLLIVGAVHIAQYLLPLARQTGFDVTIIDPRPVFAQGERFAGHPVCQDWPDDALQDMALDARTALVTLTHDAKLDDAALKIALRSEIFYIGSLGSRRTHAKRCERLAGQGFTEDTLARIHGPVGLGIRAASPAEIAVSIMAEIIAVLRGATDATGR